MSASWGPRTADPPPVRLTLRGQMVLAVLGAAVMIGALLWAFMAGQDRRCDWLQTHQPMRYAQDCQGPPDNP